MLVVKILKAALCRLSHLTTVEEAGIRGLHIFPGQRFSKVRPTSAKVFFVRFEGICSSEYTVDV